MGTSYEANGDVITIESVYLNTQCKAYVDQMSKQSSFAVPLQEQNNLSMVVRLTIILFIYM